MFKPNFMACGKNCTCNGDGSRRNFLKNCIAALTTGLAGGVLIDSFASCNPPSTKDNEMVHVMTHDGKLVSVARSQVANFKPHISDEDVRRGIPGKKFVMVIDLSKCDGCGNVPRPAIKCTTCPPIRNGSKCSKCRTHPKRRPTIFLNPAFTVITRRAPRSVRWMPLSNGRTGSSGLIRTVALDAGFAWPPVLIPSGCSTGRSPLSRIYRTNTRRRARLPKQKGVRGKM